MMNTNYFRVSDLLSDETNVTFDQDFKLKLTSKRLRSGKCQVKFFANLSQRKDLYGYVLVDADRTLKEVVSGIKDKLCTINHVSDYQNLHLYSIGKVGGADSNFIIFDS